jgi:hypothetical protein
MSKPKSKVDNLLAAIQRKAPTNAEAVEVHAGAEPADPEPPQRKAPNRATDGSAQPRGRVGKPVQFWMHDEDRRIVRELAAWLAGQGERPTDSLVIRAALRMAQTGGDLLKAYRHASQLDGRIKQNKIA